MRRILLCLMLVGLLGAPAEAGAVARPPVVKIALGKSDMPRDAIYFVQMSGYYPPRQLTGDTVPTGLTVRELKAAGFRGLYVETFVRPKDSDFYVWQYIALGSPRAAHQIFLDWARSFQYPFVQVARGPAMGDEWRYYHVVSLSSHNQGLLVRVGPYVVIGHYNTMGMVEHLMRLVVSRARRG